MACDIDGVLLTDTFSPVLHSLALEAGREYTREIERNIFSRPQKEGAQYWKKINNLDISETELNKGYFEAREKYLKTHGCGLIEGVPEFLELISSLDVRLISYGGLSEEHLADDYKKIKHYFERYVCTNDFRPGIKEITKDMYGLEYNQVLFIDDVNTVAEVAKINNVPFIGVPSNYPFGFQRQDMLATGVKYILNSVKDIDMELLEKIDHEASVGTIWERK